MRTFSFILLLTAAACGSDPTTPTASGVFPAEGFTGRSLRVEISGDATSWKDGATADFGAGVTVNSVDVASPTDLFAEITIDPAAAAATNDVTVTNAGKTYTLTKAFQLVSPTPITYSGDVAQGGVPFFTIENLDFSHQFDATQDQNTGEFLNLSIMGPPGSEFVITDASAFQLKGQIFLDTGATPGQVTVMSGTGSDITTSIPGDLDVKARAATPFTSPQTISFAEMGSSALYSFSATGTTIVHYTLEGMSADTSPVSEVLGAGGTWASDAIGASPAILESGGNGFILVESFGTAPDTVTMKGAVEALTTAPENTDGTNGTTGGALVATALPFRMKPAVVNSPDIDMIKFVVGANDANKKVHVVTTLGDDQFTDTAVDVVSSNGNTSVLPNGLSDDGFTCAFNGICGEDVVSNPLPAGTYYVKIIDGSQWSSADVDYVAALWLE